MDGNAFIARTAAAMTVVLTVLGLKMMVNVVRGTGIRRASTTISGDPANSRASRNVRVYEEFAAKRAAYMPAVAPELRACVLPPTLTGKVTLRAIIVST